MSDVGGASGPGSSNASEGVGRSEGVGASSPSAAETDGIAADAVSEPDGAATVEAETVSKATSGDAFEAADPAGRAAADVDVAADGVDVSASGVDAAAGDVGALETSDALAAAEAEKAEAEAKSKEKAEADEKARADAEAKAAADKAQAVATEVKVADVRPEVIGNVYHIEGKIDGKPVQYTGSTAQELQARFSRHQWGQLLADPETTVTAYEVLADPRPDLTERGTARSAINQALRAVEEAHRARVAGTGPLELNGIRAATPEHAREWAERHSVSVSAGRVVDRMGNRVGGVLDPVGTALDAAQFARDQRIAAQGVAIAPVTLQDELGRFTVSKKQGPLLGLFGNEYSKTYVQGPHAGQQVAIDRDRYSFYEREAKALYGYMDWKGDFQPGLLNRTLQEIPRAATVY